MGDWSEAMEDGILCRGCAGVIYGTVSIGGYCTECASCRGAVDQGKLGPGWVPDNGQDRKLLG
jgi:hypothetical protein